MRYSVAIITSCFCLLVSFTGCRVNPNAEREIALLRAEILDLEDQYYSLKGRCEASGVTTATNGSSSSNFVDGGVIYADECLECQPGTITYQNPADIIYDDAPGQYYQNDSIIESSGSTLKSDIPDQPTIIDPPAEPKSNGSGPKLEILPHGEEIDSKKSSYGRQRGGNPQDVLTGIVVNRELSRGEDIDGLIGHEGLALLLQPVDAVGNVHKIAGKLTVRITESNSPGVERQIGLWQFTPRETQSFFVKDEIAQQGILLHLPWNSLMPTEDMIRITVRYTTRDNRNLDTTMRMSIDPPDPSYSLDDPLIAGWIERDDRWIDIEFNQLDRFDGSEYVTEGSTNPVQRDPAFRLKTPTVERRISAPGWRPVR